jgi:hypothetical protein
MYHPAAALRQQSLKETMLTDMCGLPDVLIASRKARAGALATADTPPITGAPPPEIEAPAERVPAPEVVPRRSLVAPPEAAAVVEAPPPTQVTEGGEVGDIDDAVTVAVGSQASREPGAGEPQMELFG